MPYVASVRNTLSGNWFVNCPESVASGNTAVYKIFNYTDCALYFEVDCRPEFKPSFRFAAVDPFGLKELQIKVPDDPFGDTVITFQLTYRHEDTGLVMAGALLHHIIKCHTE